MKTTLIATFLMAGNAMADAASMGIEQRGHESGFRVCELERCLQPSAKLIDVPVPAAKPVIPTQVEPVAITQTEVRFALGSSKLDDDDIQRLRLLVLATSAGDNFEVVGHTDRLGSKPLNKRLAKARGSAVRRALVSHGVLTSRIRTSSECCIDYPPTTNPQARKAVVRVVSKEQ